jgi:hypothetical protein
MPGIRHPIVSGSHAAVDSEAPYAPGTGRTARGCCGPVLAQGPPREAGGDGTGGRTPHPPGRVCRDTLGLPTVVAACLATPAGTR